MKDLTNSIKESIVNKDTIDPKNFNNLYLENWPDTFTIKNASKNPKFKGKITINWDPHGGLYFSGLESDLAILAELINENTELSAV